MKASRERNELNELCTTMGLAKNKSFWIILSFSVGWISRSDWKHAQHCDREGLCFATEAEKTEHFRRIHGIAKSVVHSFYPSKTHKPKPANKNTEISEHTADRGHGHDEFRIHNRKKDTHFNRNMRDTVRPESVRTELSDRQQRKDSLSPAMHSSPFKVQILRREREGRHCRRGSRGVIGEWFYMSSLKLLWTICVAYQNHFTSPNCQVVR